MKDSDTYLKWTSVELSAENRKQIYIPNEIKKVIGNAVYRENEVGMSESQVLIYPQHVLKIQHRTSETDNEKDIVAWLNERILVPKILVYYVESDTAYTLMSKVTGKMLCDEAYLNNPEKLIKLVAEGLKQLWSVDISDCPCKVSYLQERLKEARWNVENGLVDLDNVEPETFGPNGFLNPMELINWLEQNRPEEELVLTHGDFCLPNIFTEKEKVSGFIDLGKMGPADKWQDIALAQRSLKHNFSGKYNSEKMYYKFEAQMLLDELGLERDEKKNKYYLLLDELF